MSGLLQGGPAVLFAVVLYGLFFAVAGASLRRVLVADEGIVVRACGALGVIVVSGVIWVLVCGLVYWGILLWFRFLLQEAHPWRQQILDLVGWFPFGLAFHFWPFAPGVMTALVILVGYPTTLLIAAAIVALLRRMRHDTREPRDAGGIMTILSTKRAEGRR